MTPPAVASGSIDASRSGSGHRVLPFVLFFVSGATGLVYQVVWLRQLTLIFGATAYASSAVLSTFMGGLALGSYAAGRWSDRWRQPLRAYGALELAIAAYAASIPWLLAALTPLLAIAWRLGAERHFAWLAFGKFVAIGILILPATTLMGATLPVLSRLAAQRSRSFGGGVGALYAINTFGAVVGTVGAAFVALPGLGMRRTLILTIGINAIVGVVAWLAGRERAGAPPPDEPARAAAAGVGPAPRALIAAFGASGAAAMVLEVAWTRGLSLVLGSSVYAYASMLAAFLIGLASGAACAVRFLNRRKTASPRLLLAILLGSAGALSFGTAYAIQTLPRLFAEIYFRVGPPPEGWWLAQVGLASIVMFPTTFVLGWVFPLVLEAAGARGRGIASSVGTIYAANTLGTIVGAAAAGFLLIPYFGVGPTLVGTACVQLALGAALAAGAAHPAARRVAVACVAGAALCAALHPRWDLLLMNSGVYMNIQNFDRNAGWTGFLKQVREDNAVVYAKDGLTASVVVANQPAANNLYLTVNGKTDASSREDLETQILAGQIPLLLHPSPRDVLVVGLASGISVGAVATHPVERIRVVEVEAAMLEAARLFAPFNGNVLEDPRVSVSVNDARNELEFSPRDYDVIVSEPSNPWMTVASNLFTEDFFRIARARLRPGGVFGQWIQAYCLAPEQLRSIVAGFQHAFPHVLVFETLRGVDLLLVGSDRPLGLDTEALDERLSELRIRLDLERIGVRSGVDLAGLLQTGGPAMSALVAGARSNTDDSGYVEFNAPRSIYLDSLDANLAMLQGPDDDPLATVAALVRHPGDTDAFRFEMIRRWILRDQTARASRALLYFSDPTWTSRARALFPQAD